ncbi:hypothetical protein RFM26_11290 [Mesorhizobium sp. VK23B]|uniref:Uncharacterized protein n=1 Tax=Mesorhizobium dulcispinae TaxID=3072316 RepID=A0ABU4XBA5_9HYPH|nr:MULTISPECIES: hypothetical protein [unclassified Mesorhizobium]MDX8466267.1 hypothetical protein [Mesorhizobium sp. VK23B]MDX8472077.1 hypothetical protein [Mesorhizobium sp. VK23A]MDX8517327.1 hypothetical protein [Mesorhizobium sp. VK23D]
MLIAVLASTMTVATLMATAFGLYEEAERSRSHAEADRKQLFRPARRLPVNSRRTPVESRNR